MGEAKGATPQCQPPQEMHVDVAYGWQSHWTIRKKIDHF